jgi:hypothetical protein
LKLNAKYFVVSMLIVVLLIPGQVFGSSNKAKTSSPPDNLGPFTIFDPNFKYLDDGTGNLSNIGDSTVRVWGQTLGTQRVDTIGVQVTLQRWTGSQWVDVNTGANSTFSNASYAYSSREISVSTGYYYRVKTRHWIVYGDVREEGTVYSDSLLIK